MPFAEALSILNQTETTLRRMIREGRVTAEKRRRNPDSATDFREVYEVYIPDPPSDPPTSANIRQDCESEHPPDPRPDIASGLLKRLAAQDALVAVKDAEIARINAEARALAERAARAEARAEMLAADLERSRRPWWKRILDG